jgi:hypothetical protein
MTDEEQQQKYIDCYLREINSQNRLLSPSELPENEKWLTTVDASMFGVLDENTLVLAKNGYVSILYRQKNRFSNISDTW